MPVTGIDMVQLPASSVGTVRFSEVRVPELVTPAHVPPITIGETAVKPERLSVKFTLVSDRLFGFVSVNIMEDVP